MYPSPLTLLQNCICHCLGLHTYCGAQGPAMVRGPSSNNIFLFILFLTLFVFCYSFLFQYFFFFFSFLFFVYLTVFCLTLFSSSSKCGAPLGAGPWAGAHRAHREDRPRSLRIWLKVDMIDFNLPSHAYSYRKDKVYPSPFTLLQYCTRHYGPDSWY